MNSTGVALRPFASLGSLRPIVFAWVLAACSTTPAVDTADTGSPPADGVVVVDAPPAPADARSPDARTSDTAVADVRAVAEAGDATAVRDALVTADVTEDAVHATDARTDVVATDARADATLPDATADAAVPDATLPDPCETDHGGCDLRVTCTGTAGGGRTCGACPGGFTGTGDTACVDVDECMTNHGGCDLLTTCDNAPGSFSCGACPHGYTGNGVTGCVDVDECMTNHGGCDALTACNNTRGSFTCGSCPSGYVSTAGGGCTNIDECMTNHGGCDLLATCTDSPGSFACGACPSGYTGTGTTGCTDIDECMTVRNGGCDRRLTCANSAGSYACVPCPTGYTGTGNSSCQDINECRTGNGGCDPLTVCTNTVGSFSCGRCPEGYVGSGSAGCLSDDPSLSALVPSSGTLSPAFASGTTGYSLVVGLAVSSLGLRPTVTVPAGATVTVDGAVVPSGQSSPARALALGNSAFTVVVTAASGATRTYTVSVLRASLLAQRAYVKASNTEEGDTFGESVALSGDTLVVGAPAESSNATGIDGDPSNNSAPGSGAVYVFTRTDGVWMQQAYIKASNADIGDYFGWSVALSGDTLAVGAFREASNATGVNGNQLNNSANNSGAVYVFTRAGTTWTQQAYIKASNTGAGDWFGTTIALSGDTLAVGAPNESGNATGINGDQTSNSANNSGAAYVFTRTGTTWAQQAYVKASNTGAGDYFGASVALSGDTLAVGALDEDSSATGVGGPQGDDSVPGGGAAYVFNRTGTTWAQQAYVKASNTGAYDYFGRSVALSGNTLAVGANSESTNSTGVNGTQSNTGAPYSGAVYVFTRTGGAWTQQAYVKASNTGAGDYFGWSVALSGDTLAVGAQRESSNASGIGGDQTSNSAPSSGAVYLFVRSEATWEQRAYIKASNPDRNDEFGTSVALSGDTLAVGAHGESSNATGIDGNQYDNSAQSSGAVYVF